MLVLKSTGQDVVLHVIRHHPEPEEETLPVLTTAAVVTEADSSPPSSITGEFYPILEVVNFSLYVYIHCIK